MTMSAEVRTKHVATPQAFGSRQMAEKLDRCARHRPPTSKQATSMLRVALVGSGKVAGASKRKRR